MTCGLRALSLLLAAALTVALFVNTAAAPGLRPPYDKVAHFGYFLALAAAFWGALGARRPVLVVLLAAAVGLLDEGRQAWLPGRVASAGDWAVDVAAAGVAMGCVYLARLRRAASTPPARVPRER